MALLKIDNILISGSADETMKFWDISKDYENLYTL